MPADVLQVDTIFIMIYDQNQTTIVGTPLGTVASQEVVAKLTAGLAYYIEVNGSDTGESSYDYRLVIVDSAQG